MLGLQDCWWHAIVFSHFVFLTIACLSMSSTGAYLYASTLCLCCVCCALCALARLFCVCAFACVCACLRLVGVLACVLALVRSCFSLVALGFKGWHLSLVSLPLLKWVGGPIRENRPVSYYLNWTFLCCSFYGVRTCRGVKLKATLDVQS